MSMFIDKEEVKENQDALAGLLIYAGIPLKWVKMAVAAYTAKVVCSKEQKELFDRVFGKCQT